MDIKSENTGKTDHNSAYLGSTCNGEGCIRLHTPHELREFLQRTEQPELVFRAYLITREPEDFRYLDHEQAVIRIKDGKTFDSMEDFFCYAFQCDAEGYPRTEYIDIRTDSTSS
ncbi:MAG: hypothetical protein WBJ83_05565 [Thermacetogeniaceae bacterium]